MSGASGSETERESYEKGASDSEDLSETPTSTTGSHFLTSDTKERRRSTAFEQNQGSRFPLRERSVEPSEDDKNERRTYRPESRAGDIEAAALAAVANSRRHSPGDSRRRQPLPRELRVDVSVFSVIRFNLSIKENYVIFSLSQNLPQLLDATAVHLDRTQIMIHLLHVPLCQMILHSHHT